MLNQMLDQVKLTKVRQDGDLTTVAVERCLRVTV